MTNRQSNPSGVSLRIGHDLDGVLGDWEGAIKRWLAKRLDRPEILDMPEVEIWDGWNEWGISNEDFFSHYKEMLAEGILADLEVLPEQQEFLAEATSRGHENFIVTNRFIGLEDLISQFDTYEWVSNKFSSVKIDGIIISADKAILNTDIFYDDSFKNIDNLLEAGCPYPVLIDRPYNKIRTDLDCIRVPNTATAKMAVILQVEQIMSKFENPLGGLDINEITTNSVFEPVAQVISVLARQDIDPMSKEGKGALDRAWEEVRRTHNTVNNQLRLK